MLHLPIVTAETTPNGIETWNLRRFRPDYKTWRYTIGPVREPDRPDGG